MTHVKKKKFRGKKGSCSRSKERLTDGSPGLSLKRLQTSNEKPYRLGDEDSGSKIFATQDKTTGKDIVLENSEGGKSHQE